MDSDFIEGSTYISVLLWHLYRGLSLHITGICSISQSTNAYLASTMSQVLYYLTRHPGHEMKGRVFYSWV